MKIFAKLFIVLLLCTPLAYNSTPAQGYNVVSGPLTFTNWIGSAPQKSGYEVDIRGSGLLNIVSANLTSANGTGPASYPITPTSHTDNSYIFVIPQGVVKGTYTLQFVTNDNWGRTFMLYDNQPHYFSIGYDSFPAWPTVTSVAPTSGTIGSDVTITGSNFESQVKLYFFGQNANGSVLTVNTTNNGTKATFAIPGWLNPGYYTFVLGQPSGVTGEKSLTVTAAAPYITSISPTSGVAGTEITITGGNFIDSNTVTYDSATVTGGENYLIGTNNATTLKYTTPTTLKEGAYTIKVTNVNGTSGTAAFTVVGGVEKHTEGTNVLVNGTVYRISGNGRVPYTSAGAFLSYKFNTWAGVVPASVGDLALPVSTNFIPPRNGSLINDKGTVYLITGGLRAGFASEAAFKGMGYTYANVYPGDTSFMVSMAPITSAAQKHPNGTLINDSGTLYVMHNGYRAGFPSMAVLDSWGYWASEAVPANSFDKQAEISSVIQTRMVNQLSI